MRVERTTDANVIRKVILNTSELGADSDTPIPLHESIYHVIAKDEDVMGIASFFPIDGKAWSPHMAVLPKHRGIGTELLERAMAWMAVNTQCKSLRVAVPAMNLKMIHVFDKCGFERSDFEAGHVLMERNLCLG